MRRRTKAAVVRTPHPGASLPGDLILAQDLATPAAILVSLVDRYHTVVRPDSGKPQVAILRALARHPGLPEQALSQLAYDYLWDVLANPQLRLLLLEDPTWGGRLKLCVMCGEPAEVYTDRCSDCPEEPDHVADPEAWYYPD